MISNRKTKILWICHFTNEEMLGKLPLWKKSTEFAPWIPNFIKGFENQGEFDLHVVSPHSWLKRSKSIRLRGISYHFLSFGIPVLHRGWPSFFDLDLITNYYLMKKKITSYVKIINPDLVHLHGAENPYYSSSILNIPKRIPILITIQGIVSLYDDNTLLSSKKRVEVENEIYKKFKFFSGDSDSCNYISKLNGKFEFYELYYPINESIQIQNEPMEFDLLFAGRCEKAKGVEDFIRIVSLLKKNRRSIRACIVGSIDKQYKDFLLGMIRDGNCHENISILGFTKNQHELFSVMRRSRVFLVPTYNDRIPSTIRESMFLCIPTVSYKTGSIPFINKHKECILLVDVGNWEEMALRAEEILNDSSLRETITSNAKEFFNNEFTLKINFDRLKAIYRHILESKPK